MPALAARLELSPWMDLRSLENALQGFWQNPALSLGVPAANAYPPVNIFDRGDAAVLTFEAPGLKPGDFSVSIEGRTLTVSGERSSPNGARQPLGFLRRECPSGSFSRSFLLPQELEADKASARYEAGLLTVEVPKAQPARPQRIAVQNA